MIRSKILKKQWMLLLEILSAITGLLIASREKHPFKIVSKKTLSLSISDKFLYSLAKVTIRGQSSTTSNSLRGSELEGDF